MNGGVYLIRCIPTGMIYVGAGKRVSRRLGDHRRSLSRQQHWCKALQTAWNEHGEARFEFVVIERAESDALLALEQKYLDELQPYDDRGFNTRKRANKACRDKPLPPKEAERWGQAFKGKKHTAEARERIRQAKLADNWQRGRTWTDEQRRKIMAKRPRGDGHHKSKRVAQLGDDGIVLAVWPSAIEAARSLGLKQGDTINLVCAGRRMKAGGYRWRWNSDKELNA